jgi:hypothetical protein
MIFGSKGGAGPADLPVSASVSDDHHQQRTSVPFSGGCKPTPRPVRIASMQDLNSVIPPQVQAMVRATSDLTRTTWVSNGRTSISPAFPYSLPPLPSAPVYGSVL